MQEEASSGAAPTSALPEVTQSHRFDAMGNRTLWSDAQNKRRSDSLYNEVNQLTQSKSYDTNTAPATLQSTTNFGYDPKGNLTATASTDGSGTPVSSATYTYDDADRLTGIVNPGSSKREFLYDGMSRMRVSRNWIWQGGAWVPQSEKRRVYDGMDVVQERDGANAVTANYTRLGNIGGILARSTSSGSVYFGYDGGGNVTELTDNTGSVVGTYAYDAFGNTTATSGAAAASNPYRFSTKEDVGGLYYYGSRFYAPGMGRWINRDPLREAGGLNVYGFNRNSPTNFVDNYGNTPEPIKPIPQMSCPELQHEIGRIANKIEDEFDSYKPFQDSIGDYGVGSNRRMSGQRIRKPGNPYGHFIEIIGYQNRLRNLIVAYKSRCENLGGPKIGKEAYKWSNERVPTVGTPPVVVQRPRIYYSASIPSIKVAPVGAKPGFSMPNLPTPSARDMENAKLVVWFGIFVAAAAATSRQVAR